MLESLEERRLLAFTDLAAIAGSLYYNLPGNVQQPIPIETISLYQDGNANGLFDGAPLDPLTATDTTDADGDYRFDTLSAGTYFVVQPPKPSGNIHPTPAPVVLTVVITLADADGTEGILVDHFDEPQALTAQLPPAGTPSVSGSVSASDIVGGHRQLIVDAVSGTGRVAVVIDENNNGLFNYSEEAATIGSARHCGTEPPETTRP